MRQVAVLDADIELSVLLVHDDVGPHVVWFLGGILPARTRLEHADDVDGFLDVLDRLAEISRDFRDLVLLQVLNVVVEDLFLERIGLKVAIELEQETLNEVLGANSGRIQ